MSHDTQCQPSASVRPIAIPKTRSAERGSKKDGNTKSPYGRDSDFINVQCSIAHGSSIGQEKSPTPSVLGVGQIFSLSWRARLTCS